MLSFIFSIIIAKRFGVRVDDELTTILVTLPFSYKLLVYSTPPKPSNLATTDGALRKVGVTETVARSFQSPFRVRNYKYAIGWMRIISGLAKPNEQYF